MPPYFHAMPPCYVFHDDTITLDIAAITLLPCPSPLMLLIFRY